MTRKCIISAVVMFVMAWGLSFVVHGLRIKAALLKKTYDQALNRHDLLLMPTTPMKATPIPAQDAPLALYCQRGFEMLPNTAPFDVSGHPAMNVPCGISAGLPVGMQLVGAHYAESTIYRAAHAFEQLGDWRNF